MNSRPSPKRSRLEAPCSRAFRRGPAAPADSRPSAGFDVPSVEPGGTLDVNFHLPTRKPTRTIFISVYRPHDDMPFVRPKQVAGQPPVAMTTKAWHALIDRGLKGYVPKVHKARRFDPEAISMTPIPGWTARDNGAQAEQDGVSQTSSKEPQWNGQSPSVDMALVSTSGRGTAKVISLDSRRGSRVGTPSTSQASTDASPPSTSRRTAGTPMPDLSIETSDAS